MSSIERPTWDELLMDMAFLVSERSVIPTKVGAVLVHDRRVVSMGYNGKPAGCTHIHRDGNYELDEIHAEQNAIAFAARRGISTDGATLYCTVAPCIHCAKLLIAAGIKYVICINKTAKNQDSCPDGVPLLMEYGINVRFVQKADSSN